MMEHEYYFKAPPKFVRDNTFNNEYAKEIYKNAIKVPQDILATVTAQCAYAIYQAYREFIEPQVQLEEIILSGVNAENETLRKYLIKLLPEIKFTTLLDYGIDNQNKETLAVAYLGYMTVKNKCNNVPGATGASHGVCMGKISY